MDGAVSQLAAVETALRTLRAPLQFQENALHALVAQALEKTGLPLVMHGGSGVSDEDYRIAIRNGIRKINYYSYMSKAAVSASQEMLNTQDVTFWHDLALTARQAMEKDAERAMRVFAGL